MRPKSPKLMDRQSTLTFHRPTPWEHLPQAQRTRVRDLLVELLRQIVWPTPPTERNHD